MVVLEKNQDRFGQRASIQPSAGRKKKGVAKEIKKERAARRKEPYSMMDDGMHRKRQRGSTTMVGEESW